jgi:PAS domain S-box-containing protein
LKRILKWSIRTHLLVLVVLAVLPAVGIILYTGVENRKHAVEEAKNASLRMVSSIAFEQERAVEDARQLLATLSKLSEVQRLDVQICNKLFSDLLIQNPSYADIMFADLRGIIRASALAFPLSDISVNDRKYFKNVLKTRDFTIGEYAVSKAYNIPCLHFAYPLEDKEGRLTGVLIAAFRLAYYGKLLSQARLPEGSVLSLTDRRGIRLYRYPEPEKYVGKRDLKRIMKRMSGQHEEETFIKVGVDGVRRLYAYKRLFLGENASPYLFLRVGIPEKIALAKAKFMMMRNLSLLGIVFLFAMLVALLMGNFTIIRPLNKLLSASRRLGRGDSGVRTDIPHDEAELGQLANAFDDMAEDLEKRDSERRLAEEALRKSEEKYRTLIECTLDLVFTVDEKDFFTYLNPRFETTTGYTSSDLIGKPFIDIVAPKFKEVSVAGFKQSMEGGTITPYEADVVHKNGKRIPVEFLVVTLFDEEGKAVGRFGIGRDITDRKKLEKQLIQARKMEAIGTLAGGIAHDFNNLLMGIQGHASLMLLDVDPDHPHYRRLKNIEEQVMSGASLTKQLLGFARRGMYEVRTVNINKIIEETSEMFGRTRKEITIHRNVQKDLWPTAVDRGQIEQVLLNIYLNAWHAMPGGGDLYVETENSVIDDDFSKPAYVSPGKYVKISLTDTGVGMDEKTKERIFEPFFTTKEMRRGTGLGLASAYGIMKGHGGFIDVHSEVEQGTTFTLYLPASEKRRISTGTISADVTEGDETILLVDDEEIIANVSKEILEELGYSVITARSGSDAVKIYQSMKDEIDLVILDMVMPEMGGGETFDLLKLISPQVKVILSSGYSIDGQAMEIMERGCHGFIQKPFSIEDLSKKIREVLDTTYE